MNGEKETGISIIKISAKLDEGDILAQKSILIGDEDDAVSIKEKMKEEGPRLLLDTIQSLQNDEFCLAKQDPSKASVAPKLSKEMGHINWKKDAVIIHNSVRGLVPWPSAYTHVQDKMLKILQTKVIELEHLDGVPGEVLAILKDGFVVRCGRGALLVKKVHLESSRLMDAKSFVVGHKIEVGFRFI
jgi:methionyl-tRNA formyltransferase